MAAADIAVMAGAAIDVPAYQPMLQGVLLTGDEPEFLQRRPQASPGSEAALDPLWWPPQKVVGRHLGPYLEALGARTVRSGAGTG